MEPERMTLGEFAKAEAISNMSAMNILRTDSTKPKHERQYPFIASKPPSTPGGRWNYIIPRQQYKAWKSGAGVQMLDYDRLAAIIVQKLTNQIVRGFCGTNEKME
jgi:hypothetical protein